MSSLLVKHEHFPFFLEYQVLTIIMNLKSIYKNVLHYTPLQSHKFYKSVSSFQVEELKY